MEQKQTEEAPPPEPRTHVPVGVSEPPVIDIEAPNDQSTATAAPAPIPQDERKAVTSVYLGPKGGGGRTVRREKRGEESLQDSLYLGPGAGGSADGAPPKRSNTTSAYLGPTSSSGLKSEYLAPK